MTRSSSHLRALTRAPPRQRQRCQQRSCELRFHSNDFSARFSDFRTGFHFSAVGNSFLHAGSAPPPHHHRDGDGRPTVNDDDDDTRNNKIDSTSTASTAVVCVCAWIRWLLRLLLLPLPPLLFVWLGLLTKYDYKSNKYECGWMCLLCVKITYWSIKGVKKTYLHADIEWFVVGIAMQKHRRRHVVAK